MKVEMFVLCDAATEYMGKLNLLGTFDSIHTRQVPAAHPFCAVAIRLRFERSERGDHRMRVNLVDADGQLVIPSLDANLPVRFPDEAPSLAMNLILNLQGVRFARFGEYSIDLIADGQPAASVPLFVRQLPMPN